MAASSHSIALRRRAYYLLVWILRPLVPFLTHWRLAWKIRALFFKSAASERWLQDFGPDWDAPEVPQHGPPFTVIVEDERRAWPETLGTIAEDGFVLYIGSDCTAHPQCAPGFFAAATAHPEVDLWYSDEVQVSEGCREVFCKPAWDPLYFSHSGYTGRCFAMRGALLKKLLQEGRKLPRDQELFAAALALLNGGNRIGHLPRPLYEAPAQAFPAPRPQAALPPEPSRWPKVSIIIPFRDRLDLLRPCLETMEQETDYPDWECVLVDNGSTAEDILAFLAALPPERFRALRHDAPFNFSELVNCGAREANGDFVLLMNNDVTIVEPGWLKALVRYGLSPLVGCVGAKLLYPNGLIQHGGMLRRLGRPIDGLAAPGQCHAGWPGDSNGYFGLLASPRLTSALAGAVLLAPRDLYLKLGGFDEGLAVAMNDSDFCFKVWAAGRYCVWTPDSVLVHHESASRKMDIVSKATRERLSREWALMREKWGAFLEEEPWYNPNLGRDGSYALASPPAERTARILPAYKDI